MYWYKKEEIISNTMYDEYELLISNAYDNGEQMYWIAHGLLIMIE